MTRTPLPLANRPESQIRSDEPSLSQRKQRQPNFWYVLLCLWFIVQISNVIDRGPLIGVTEYLSIPFGRWRMFTTYSPSGQNRRLAYVVHDDTGRAKRLEISMLLNYHDPRRSHIRGDQNFCLRIAEGQFDRPGAIELVSFIEREFERRFAHRMRRLDVYEQAWSHNDGPEEGTTRLAMRFSDERIASGEPTVIPTAVWMNRWSERWE
jgi:hypothetical protein